MNFIHHFHKMWEYLKKEIQGRLPTNRRYVSVYRNGSGEYEWVLGRGEAELGEFEKIETLKVPEYVDYGREEWYAYSVAAQFESHDDL